MNDPSSTHSSPRSFHSDLYPSSFPHYNPHHPHHSQTYPIPNYPSRPLHKSTLPALPISLSVSTSTTASEHDPNETTARPSNAHKHAQFLSGALTSTHLADSDPPRSLLFSDPSSSDDPGATPVVTHPPSTTSAAGLPTPLNSADPSSNPSSNDSRPSPEFSLSDTPGLSRGLSRPLTAAEQEKLAHLDRLKFFLATAPSQWDNARPTQSFAPTTGSNAYPSASIGVPSTVGSSTGWGMGLPPGNGGSGPGGDAYAQGMHPSLNRFMLPSQEFVTCVLWNGLYHITGTDIVRALVFRFEAFGRPVRNMKKFEEGVFSDLRNLKPGVDACLEEPKSPFLDLLFKYQCIRTQKKQKVFYWFSVPHDRLFLDALERDLKREKMGQEPTTHVVGEPALSFTYDPKRSLYEQFAKAQGIKDGESELESTLRRAEQDASLSGDGSAFCTSSESDAELIDGATGMGNLHIGAEDSEMSDADDLNGLTEEEREKRKRMKQEQRKLHLSKVNGGGAAFLSNMLKGSPTYKMRRKKNPAAVGAGSALSRSVSSSSSVSFRRGSEDYDERGRPRSMGSYGSGLAERHLHQSASVSRERSYPYPQPYSIHRHHSQGQPPFQYASMSEEFGPGSLDARERAELDAATLFHRQAKGQLMPADGVVRKPKVQHVHSEVGVMISEGYTAHQVQGVGTPGSQQSQFPGHSSSDIQQSQLDAFTNGYDPSVGGIFPAPHQPSQQQPNDPNSQTAGPTQYETVSADGKFRAFMCPSDSCGRLFKRMEHLKRHFRTHTMEKPYMCTVCQRRFSRSDNLNQHLRTHERTGSAITNATASSAHTGTANFGAAGGNMGAGVEGMSMNVNAMNGMEGFSMDMWRDNGEDSDLSGAESEGFDDEGYHLYDHHNHPQAMMNDPGMFGMSMLGAANTTLGIGVGGGFDIQMCEVEVGAGDVSEIPGGEEEGLLLRNHAHGSLTQFATVPSTASHQQDFGSSTTDSFAPDASAQWTQPQPQPSPAFSTLSVPSPPPGTGSARAGPGPQSIAISRSSRSSIGSSPAGFMRPTHSASSSTSSLSGYNGSTDASNGMNGNGPEDFVTSMSAPSHKQAFDHASLYAPGMLDSASSTGSGVNAGGNTSANSAGVLAGPIRRHRSMTPSLIGRSGESIRRPTSTASNMSGGAGGGNGEGSGSASPVPSVGGVMGGVPTGMGMAGGGMAMGSARAYHPYAGGYASSSRSGSAHSSPAVYNVPLGTAGEGQQQQHGLRRPESRTSFVGMQVHDQMLQGAAGGAGAGAGAGGEMFRTESPGSFIPQQMAQQHQQMQQQQHVQQMHPSQTESPAPYSMELPSHQMYGHANTVPVGVYDPHAAHQGPQMGTEGGAGGYYSQTHATL